MPDDTEAALAQERRRDTVPGHQIRAAVDLSRTAGRTARLQQHLAHAQARAQSSSLLGAADECQGDVLTRGVDHPRAPGQNIMTIPPTIWDGGRGVGSPPSCSGQIGHRGSAPVKR